MNLDDTIVAISSPRGSAPRGIVRLSGPDAIRIAADFFTPGDPGDSLAAQANCHIDGTARLLDYYLPASAMLFRAPRSYTRQDIVELHLLGAPGVLALVLDECLAAGARKADPGEFTARAFLAGVFDLSQVHGIAGLIAARSDHQLRAAERLLHGALADAANAAHEELADLLSLVEGAMDFADEPIQFISPQEIRRRLGVVRQALSATSAAGLRAERWGELPRVVLTGAPNAGKSSLLNRLTGLDRAICAPIAGTTRDVLSAPLPLESIECLLIDAAGLDAAGPQSAGDLRGAARAAARRAIKDADLILHVVDVSGPHDSAVLSLPRETPPDVPRIVVANKCDLLSSGRLKQVIDELKAKTAAVVCPTSALDGSGCDALKKQIEQAVCGREVDIHDAAIALMAEHREALDQALDALQRAIDLAAECDEELNNADLVAAELHIAADALAALVGQEDTEQLLGRIFSRFCVGK